MLNKSPNFKVLKKKQRKGKIKKNVFVNDSLIHGNIAIMSLSNSVLTLNELESIRKLLMRKLKDFNKGGKFRLFFRIFPHKMLTEKSKGSRMGKGKGGLHSWVCPVKKGQYIIEVSGLFEKGNSLKNLIQNLCSKKLNIKVSYIHK